MALAPYRIDGALSAKAQALWPTAEVQIWDVDGREEWLIEYPGIEGIAPNRVGLGGDRWTAESAIDALIAAERARRVAVGQ